jgi:fructan beta-fructosidase
MKIRTVAMRSIEVRSRFLHLPVRAGAPMRRLTVGSVGNTHVFDIELADGEAEWWAFFDLAPFSGQTISVALDGHPSGGLDAIHQSDEIVGAETLYREQRRPQLRFSARRGWLNDPNGLVFFAGEYHLFFQHNPYGVISQNKHWGHAVSPDLVHWEELPTALYPDELGQMYSGSAVVDWQDSAGLRHGAEPPLIALYTAANEPYVQCLASSNDRGHTWQKYSDNPVLPGGAVGSRDPKVFRHPPSDRWVMVLYLDSYRPDEHPGRAPLDVMHEINRYGVFVSRDLINWEATSEFVIPGDAECPELFELPVHGGEGVTRWIAWGAMGHYLVGSFDGETFTPESGPHALNAGESFYAGQTFSDIPSSDGRRIVVAWGAAPNLALEKPLGEGVFAGMPFTQSMSLPVELELHTTADGPRLFAAPVRELAMLRSSTTRIVDQQLPADQDALAGLTGELWEICADIALGDAREVVLEVRGVPITYDAQQREISCAGTSAALEPIDGRIRLQVFVDRTAIDLFGNDGRLYMSVAVDLTSNDPHLFLRAQGGTATVVEADIHKLSSVWSVP